MERVLIVGCPGGGKSTFARALRDRTGLPLHYLDRIWHKADGSHLSREEFDRRLAELLAGDRWILDGNYLRTLEPRLARCDTVFFLDYPPALCLEGAAARIGRPREDLPWVETSLDPEFRRQILDFPREERPLLLRLLERYGEGREVHIFRSREEGDAWLEQAAKGHG